MLGMKVLGLHLEGKQYKIQTFLIRQSRSFETLRTKCLRLSFFVSFLIRRCKPWGPWTRISTGSTPSWTLLQAHFADPKKNSQVGDGSRRPRLKGLSKVLRPVSASYGTMCDPRLSFWSTYCHADECSAYILNENCYECGSLVPDDLVLRLGGQGPPPSLGLLEHMAIARLHFHAFQAVMVGRSFDANFG